MILKLTKKFFFLFLFILFFISDPVQASLGPSDYVITKIIFENNFDSGNIPQIMQFTCSKEAYDDKDLIKYCKGEDCQNKIFEYIDTHFDELTNDEKKCVYLPSISFEIRCFDDYCYASKIYDDNPEELFLMIYYLDDLYIIKNDKIKAPSEELFIKKEIKFEEDGTAGGNNFYFNPLGYKINIDNKSDIKISEFEIQDREQLVNNFTKDLNKELSHKRSLYEWIFFISLGIIFIFLIFIFIKSLKREKK